MESYFSLGNNAKYLILSKTLINPFILLNRTSKGLKSIKLLCYKLKYFHMIFHLLKYHQDQNLQF